MKLQITVVEGYLYKSYSPFLSEEYFFKTYVFSNCKVSLVTIGYYDYEIWRQKLSEVIWVLGETCKLYMKCTPGKKNCWISLGSFSIDDGDGSENVTLNMNQRFFNFVAFIPVRWKRLM